MSDFYSATIFLSVFIMIIMDMLVSGNDLMECGETGYLRNAG